MFEAHCLMTLLATISNEGNISQNDISWVSFGLGILASLIVTAIHPIVRNGLIGFFPYFFSCLMPRQGISLGGHWYALYVENGRVRHEIIKIRDCNTFIRGKICLKFQGKHYKYSLNGKYENEVLIATYRDKNHKDDERGVIISRKITENVLYGYASSTPGNRDMDFCHGPHLMVKMDAQTRAEQRKLLKNPELAKIPSSLDFCKDCKEVGCCCASESVDMPIMFSFECDNIQMKYNKNKVTFAESIKDIVNCKREIYRMKSREITDQHGKKKMACVFYDGKKCTIYENRPIDCRLFPFDIKMENNELVFGYHDLCAEVCGKNIKDNIMTYNYFTKPYIYLLRPYIKEFASPASSTKLNQSYRFIKYEDDFFGRILESCGLKEKP